MSGLVDAHADTAILVKTEEHVAMSARHHVHERGEVSLQRNGANGLSDLRVHHYDLPGVHNQ